MPFVRGQSGNPGGRPIDPLLHALRRKLTKRQAASLMDVLVQAALNGDMKAMEMIWDRVAGKPVARAEQGGPGDFARGFEIRLIRVARGDDGDDDAAAS
jgi:hypothetical protein